MVVVIVAAAKPQPELGVCPFHKVRDGQAEEDKDPELRLQIEEAVVSHALHLDPKEREVRFEERYVKEHEVGVQEFQQHHLHQHVLLMLRLCAVVLPLCQVLGSHAKEVVDELHKSGKGKLEGHDAHRHLVLHLVPGIQEACQTQDEDYGEKGQGHRTLSVPPNTLIPGEVRFYLRSDRVDARLARVLRPAGLESVRQVQGAPTNGILCLLPPPKVRKESRPDTHQDAERDGCHVVRRAREEVYELQPKTDNSNRKQPLDVPRHEQEVECYPIPKVVSDLVGLFFRHAQPLKLLQPGLPHQVFQRASLVEWQVRLEIALVLQISYRNARTVLVFGRDDVVNQVDLVERFEDGIGVREIVLCVCLVDVGDNSPVPEVALWPAREVVSVFCIGTQILLLQLQLVLHPRSCVPQLLGPGPNLHNDFVPVAAVVAEEV
mmetsp:Transcript_81244/g.188719  ORF Transcript_81244/g.188719 Transcript_81244/m.188719 type:complete len:434 (-) Transcript_81244:364-1665(-)